MLVEFLSRYLTLSRKLGAHDRHEGLLKHIGKEIEEVRDDPTDIEEWMDIAWLAFDGALNQCGDPQKVADIFFAKGEKNLNRTWPENVAADQPIEHIHRPDLDTCPSCGGAADNGHDRGYPPSPYYCTKCSGIPK